MRLIVTIFSVLLCFSLNGQNNLEIALTLGHRDNITQLSIIPGTKVALTSSRDNTIRIWDLKQFSEFGSFHEHRAGVFCFAITPNGKKVVSGDQDGVIILWSLPDMKVLKKYDIKSAVTSISINPEGTKALVADGEKAIRILDLATEKGVNLQGASITNVLLENFDRALALFSSDGKLAVYTNEEKIIVYDIESNKEIGRLKGHKKDVTVMTFDPSGKILVTGSNDKTIKFWDLQQMKLTGTISDHESPIASISYSSDGKKLVTAEIANTIKIRDVTNNSVTKSIYNPQGGVVGATLINQDKQLIMFGGVNLMYLDYSTGKVLKTISAKERKKNYCLFSGERINMEIYGDQKTTLNPENLTIAETKKYQPEVFTPSKYDRILSTYDASYMVIHCDGTHPTKSTIGDPNPNSASAMGTHYLSIYDIRNKEKIGEFEVLDNVKYSMFRFMTISRDRTRFVYRIGKTVKIIQLVNGRLIPECEFEAFEVMNRAAISNDNQTLITFSPEGNLYKWDLLKVKQATNSKNQGSVAFNGYNPDWKIKVPIIENSSICISPSGKLAATGNANGEVFVVNTSNGSALGTCKSSGKSALPLSISADDKFILINGTDEKLVFISLETMKEVLYGYVLSPREWFFYTPDKYYFCSKNMSEFIRFRKAFELYNYEQFDLLYNRPDKVLSALGYAKPALVDSYKNAWIKRLIKMGISESNLNPELIIPSIQIQNRDQIKEFTSTQTLHVEISANDKKNNISSIHALINGVPIFGNKGISLGSNSSMEIKQNLEIPLAVGENRIQLYVVNSAGLESYRERLTIYLEGEQKAPELYLISIGAGTYKNTGFNLKYAEKDAKDVSMIFQESVKKGVFSSIKEKVYTGAQVTKATLNTDIPAFLSSATRNDVVIFFYAGHGVLDEKLNYYLAMHDMDFNVPVQKGLEYAAAESWLESILPLKKIVMIDACHSGEVDKEEMSLITSSNLNNSNVSFRNTGYGARKKAGVGMKTSSELAKELFTDLRKGTGATVISSAGGAEFALESEKWKNGLFTYTLIKGLREYSADLNRDGKIMLSEIQLYVRDQVSTLSKGSQIPSSRIENIELDIKLW